LPTSLSGFTPGQPGFVPGPGPTGASGSTVQQGYPSGFVIPGGQQAAQPGMNRPGDGSIPGVPVFPAPVTSVQTTAGGSPSVMPGQLPGGAANPALRMIQDMLTRPNPRGLQGIPTAPSAQQQPATPMLAGVASNLEEDSIKVYNDRTKYNEWEFLYDPRTDRFAMAAGQMGQTGSGAGPQGGGSPGGAGLNPSTGPGGLTPPGGMGPGGRTPTPRIPGWPGRGR
jgi:hypothetical protein